MSLQKPLLDAIVESDHEGSVMVDHATDDSTSEVDESFVQLDGDEFRLDQEARRKGPVGKKLFVEEDSIAESPLRNGLLGPSLIASSPQKSDLESPSKRVQFKHHIDSASEEEPISEQPIDQWNFKDLIGDRFRERLPETDLKAWQRPSKRLLNSITDILENNIDLALEATFEKYEAECERLAIGRSVKHIRRDKERMLHKTIGKIERQLQSSKFPSRVKDPSIFVFVYCDYILFKDYTELARSQTCLSINDRAPCADCDDFDRTGFGNLAGRTVSPLRAGRGQPLSS